MAWCDFACLFHWVTNFIFHACSPIFSLILFLYLPFPIFSFSFPRSMWFELTFTFSLAALTFTNKWVWNLAVSKEPWDIPEVIRDKHGINKNIPGLGPQKKYSSRATSAAEKACLSLMTPNWRMRKWNTELAYSNLSPVYFYFIIWVMD